MVLTSTAVVLRWNVLIVCVFTLVLSLLLTLVGSRPALAEGVTLLRSTSIELTDTQTERTYPVYIKLPPSYKKSERRYPVVYMTDAPYSFQLASGTTRLPMNAGKMDEVIIVAIGFAQGESGRWSRVRDFTPYYSKDWEHKTGDAEQHIRFMQQQVFTHMDKHYRTDVTNRTFVGNSLGGLLGAYMLLNHQGLFNNYVIGSPSLWFKEYEIIKAFKKQTNFSLKSSTRVYVGVGENESKAKGMNYDMAMDARRLARLLATKSDSDTNVELGVIANTNHYTAFPSVLMQGLYWLFQKQTDNN